MKIKTAWFLLLCVAISGIAPLSADAWWKVSPKAKEISPDAPQSWSIHVSKTASDSTMLDWWRQFHDDTLDQFIQDAVRFNYDLKQATANIAEARALRGGASANLFPKIDAKASYSRRFFSRNGSNPLGQIGTLSRSGPAASDNPFRNFTNPLNVWQLGFDATWEVDLFGRDRWQVEQADARIGAQVEHYRAVLISVISEVARAYIELRGTQEQIAVTEEGIRLQRETLELTRKKQRIGLASDLDVSRAAALLETTQADLPDLRARMDSDARQIATLTGREPGALLADLQAPKPLPEAPDVVAVGLPAELIRRRPDIRQAERELTAATAGIGAARAELYPRVSTNAALGLESLKLSDLLNKHSYFWSIEPVIRWRIFERQSIKADIHAAQAQQMAAEAHFQETFLQALKDTETAMNDLNEARSKQHSLVQAATETRRSAELSQGLYQSGLASYLDVLDAQRSLNQIENRLTQARMEATLQTIRLYKALGGGWEVL